MISQTVQMDERILIKSLTIIIVTIILLNIINIVIDRPSWQIDRFVNVDIESNFTTWFSGLLLGIAAFFAYKCSLITKTNKKEQRMWQLLSLGLLRNVLR